MFRYIFTPREKGGQYSRYQLVVTIREMAKDPKKLPSLLQSMLHEISHQWWKKTPLKTYDNFLDEALAEYTSSLIVSEHFGEEWLEQRINKVKELLEKPGELPAIRKTVRADKESYSLFYYRGFLLMRELHMKMGTEHFKKMVRAFAEKCVKNKSITTRDFLATLKETSIHMKEDLVHIVNCWLDYSGKGVPSDC